MFSPEVIDRREHELAARFGDALPGGKLLRRPHDECWAMKDQLADAVDSKGNPARALTTAEEHFLIHERLACKLDYRYWSERYAVIVKDTGDAEPLTPRWKSQELFLDHLAWIETNRLTTGSPDGVLANVLKARQLGLSSETEVILAHQATTNSRLKGLVAGDVPEQSKYLLGMAELVIEELPWWLKPKLDFHQAGSFLQFSTGTSLRASAGKSQRGGLQDKGGTKGNIGRGKTYNIAHLSEISTWERPEQIEDGLMPGIPERARTFMIRESTAKGRNDYWHEEWKRASRGLGRFHNIFIPWYIEPEKYWAPPPAGWVPSATSQQHAELVERTSPQWLFGKTVKLDREQLYWYEQRRAKFEADDNLHKFMEEFPAEPEESFQYSGRSIFNSTVLDRLRGQERLPVAVMSIQPAKDIAVLKAWEKEVAATRG